MQVGTIKAEAVAQLNQTLADVIDLELFCRTYNRVRRDYREEHPWRWNRSEVKLTLATDVTYPNLYSVAVPVDYNGFHQPSVCYYDSYSGETKPLYLRTWGQLDAGLSGYMIHDGKVVSDQAAVYFTYWPPLTDLPLNSSQDATEEPFFSGTAVINLLIGRYWYEVERKTGKHQEFLDLYKSAVQAEKDTELLSMGVVSASYPLPLRQAR